MTTHDIPSLLSALRERLADLGHVEDAGSDRARTAWYRIHGNLSTTISELQNPVDPKIAERLSYWREKRAAWQQKHDALHEALAAAPDDAATQRALELLRRGNLVSGPGSTYGTLDGLDQIIAEIEAKQMRAQRRYDAAVQRAVALVAEEKQTTTSSS